MTPPALDHHRPVTLADALAALRATDGATPIAGGQSLLPMLSLRVTAPALLVGIGRLPDLRRSSETPSLVRLGAGVTHAEIEDRAVPDPSRGMMPRVAAGIAYRSVRNFGTIGGSLALADPAADWPACLLALDATVLAAGPDGERRVPVRDFVLGPYATTLVPGEIVVAVEIPVLAHGTRWGWRKLARQQGAYADSLGAVVLPGDGVAPRVVLGANGDRPVILAGATAALARAPDLAAPALRDVIAADIHAIEPDPFRHRCHVATVERAVAEART